MDRLTKRFDDGVGFEVYEDYYSIDALAQLRIYEDEEKQESFKMLQKIANALAAFEDNGITPEQMREISDEYRKVCEELHKVKAELAEYKRLEEQGLLLRLPCKVGTPVYMVAQDCGGDTLDCRRGDCEGCRYLYSFVEENKFDTYMCDDIGKTVFLTKGEAEQALAKMKNGMHHGNRV